VSDVSAAAAAVVLCQISRGAYGRVHQVKKKFTGEHMAAEAFSICATLAGGY
jgi:hypothetical protein